MPALTGWGMFFQFFLNVQETWSSEELELLINILELRAIELTLQYPPAARSPIQGAVGQGHSSGLYKPIMGTREVDLL